ncbi:MAG TPA: hypothetical protein DCQ98_11870, partial [Planctomycetaceae bacterium]|nr:hypothetical protein [Planctomycetaceae bacterium]
MEVLREGRVIGRHVDSFVPETARRHRLTADDVEKQLGRLGGTPFVLERVELVVD